MLAFTEPGGTAASLGALEMGEGNAVLNRFSLVHPYLLLLEVFPRSGGE